MAKITARRGSGNIFRDVGFTEAQASELAIKSALINAIRETIEQRGLAQQEAAKLCRQISQHFRKSFEAGWKA